MKNRFVPVLSDVTMKKLDVVLWVLSVPLPFMLAAEFFSAISPETKAYFQAYYIALWIIFVVEFVLHIAAAKDKVAYLKANWFDVLVVLTPALRVLQIFRFISFPMMLFSDELLQVLSTFSFNFFYYLIAIGIIVFGAADVTLFFESQDPNSNVRTFGDALWLVIGYVTSSGNSRYDVDSLGGKIIGVILMTLGFAIFSILIASLVSIFMREYTQRNKDQDLLEGIKEQLGVDEILTRLERIEKRLDKK